MRIISNRVCWWYCSEQLQHKPTAEPLGGVFAPSAISFSPKEATTVSLWPPCEDQCLCEPSLTFSTLSLCHKGEEGMQSTAQTLPPLRSSSCWCLLNPGGDSCLVTGVLLFWSNLDLNEKEVIYAGTGWRKGTHTVRNCPNYPASASSWKAARSLLAVTVSKQSSMLSQTTSSDGLN